MSTSSVPSAPTFATPDALARLRRLVRGRESDPGWSRPGLIAVSVLAAVLVFWSLTLSGYANSWYADGALAASQSWHALFFNAADASGLISLDKGPLSDWMMGLFGRVFGFGSFSMLLPDALCGIGAVVLLHDAVRRTLGHRAALLAALALALSPVSVVMARYNNPDALLALLLVASAWALVRAIERGRLRDILLCGLFVGLAFNTKMLEAYIIVPGLALAYLLCARGGLRRRLGHLLAGGAVMVIVSFAWFTTMMLIPSGDRPFVADTTNNSWFSLIFGANGLSRLTGGGHGGFAGGGGSGASTRAAEAFRRALGSRFAGGHGGHGGFGGFAGSTGILRLFTGSGVGGQIAWLLPLALVGLLAGLWLTRRAGRQDPRRAALVLFGVWALASFVVFSFSNGTFHPYYTSSMAPAVAALAAGGAVMLAERLRTGVLPALLAGAAVVATAVVAFILLGDTASFVPWLRWVIAGAAAVSLAAVGVIRFGLRLPRRATVPVALGASAVALLGGPTAYAIATVGHGQTGSNPTAGPASAETSGFGGGRGLFGGGRSFAGAGAFGEAGRGASGDAAGGAFAGHGAFGGRGAEGDTANRALVSYLQRHRDGAKYLIAATGSTSAAPIALTTRDPVITIGGFTGSDPAPTEAQLKQLVAGGELRYVMFGGGFGGGGFGGFAGGGGFPGGGSFGDAAGGSAASGSSSGGGLGALFGSGGGSGSATASSATGGTSTTGRTSATGGAVGGFGRRGDTAVDRWVESSCQSVTVPGESSSGGASELYLCTPADAAKGAR